MGVWSSLGTPLQSPRIIIPREFFFLPESDFFFEGGGGMGVWSSFGGSQKGGFQKGGFGGCSLGTKTGTRVRSPKPPF